MNKILFDWNVYGRGGIYRYMAELLKRLENEDSFELTLLTKENTLPPTVPTFRRLVPRMPLRDLFRGRCQRLSQPLVSAYWGYVAKDFSLYHNLTGISLPSTRVRQVATVYDMIPFELPELREFGVYDHIAKQTTESVRRSDRIIAISNETKRGIIDHLGIAPDKIEVIHLGVDADFFGRRSPEVQNPVGRDYFLHVGARDHYKRGMFLLEAFFNSRVKQDCLIVLAGEALYDEEKSLIAEFGAQERVKSIETPSNEKLRDLYQHALALVSTSSHEGFGLPVLEAMAAGTPVIIPRTSCFPEVAGDAALYFEVDDKEDLAARMEEVLSPTVSEELRRKGLQRANLMTWERCSEATLDVYKRML